MNDYTFDEWLAIGMKKGWVGPPVCETHDGFPMSEGEYIEMDLHGEAPCMHMLRLYDDEAHREAVEETHSPSVWRKSGWE